MNPTPNRVAGKTAIVTGGRGDLGSATAALLAEHGARRCQPGRCRHPGRRGPCQHQRVRRRCHQRGQRRRRRPPGPRRTGHAGHPGQRRRNHRPRRRLPHRLRHGLRPDLQCQRQGRLADDQARGPRHDRKGRRQHRQLLLHPRHHRRQERAALPRHQGRRPAPEQVGCGGLRKLRHPGELHPPRIDEHPDEPPLGRTVRHRTPRRTTSSWSAPTRCPARASRTRSPTACCTWPRTNRASPRAPSS